MTGGRRRRAAQVLGAALVSLAGTVFGGTVTRVSAVSTSAGLELRIFASGFSDSRLFLLDGPNRIVLDISGAEKNSAAPATPVNAAGVRAGRSAQYKPDMVRIVIDLERALPTYRLSRVETGFLILFPRDLPGAPPVIEIVKPKTAEPASATAPAAAPSTPPAEVRPGVDTTIKIIEQPPASVPAPVAPARRPAEESPAAAARPAPKTFRLSAAADLFLFRDSALASAYGKPVNYGVRFDIRLSDFAGLWAGVDFCRRSAAVPGETHTLRLIPIEAGIKFIMSRGFLAPYVGFGAVYFLYREETPSGTVSLDAFGLTSLAGILFRLGPSLTLDFYARYRRLPVDLALRSFDAGGFHFGGAIGLAF